MQIDYINGKHVIHFLEIADTDDNDGINAISNAYRRARNFARDFGGRKFHNRSYGGGIAFDYQQQAKDCIEAYHSNNKLPWTTKKSPRPSSNGWPNKNANK